jgi:tRNA (adenine57-N1/adenine58-N1)-methyltransferase
MALRASCLRALRLNPSTKRHVSSNCQTFAEGDRVKLQHHAGRDKVHMTTPLRAEKTTNTHAGVLHHSDIIGCGPRDIISTNKGSEFRLSWPTLEEYVVKVPRLVTPVSPRPSSSRDTADGVTVDLPSRRRRHCKFAGYPRGRRRLASAGDL